MADLNQIRENSLTYNGPRSKITATAGAMVAMGTKALDEVGGVLHRHGYGSKHCKLQEAELISQLESKMEDVAGRGSSEGPPISPTASSSALDSSADMMSLSQGGVGMGGGEEGEVDVVQWEEGEGGGVELVPWGEEAGGGEEEGVDLLLEDLQASSNSEDDTSDGPGD